MAINNLGRPRTPGYPIGHQFKYLTIVGFADTVRKDGYVREGYVCRCTCGKEQSRSKAAIARHPDARCNSCAGKVAAGKRVSTKNSVHPLYGIWRNMLKRCENPRSHAYKDYGARGITVCERWHALNAFIEDMHPRPAGLSIERRDNNKGYSPDNCYWATAQEQNSNTRTNRWVTVGGVRKNIAQWARVLDTKAAVIRNRIEVHGWTEEAACTVPVVHYARTAPVLTVGGVTKPAATWAREMGISGAALKGRIDRGWTIEEACTIGKCGSGRDTSLALRQQLKGN